MKTTTIKLYSFDELSEVAKKKALESFRDINTEIWQGETVIEIWKEKLAKHGFENAEIHFSGFWSQRDGASFDADINVSKFTTDKRIIAIAEEYCNFRIEKNSFANHYSHERTRYTEYDALDDKFVRINDKLNKLSETIEEERYDLCRKIYKELEEEYNYLSSDESIKETIEANEYLFFEDGKSIPFNLYPKEENENAK